MLIVQILSTDVRNKPSAIIDLPPCLSDFLDEDVLIVSKASCLHLFCMWDTVTVQILETLGTSWNWMFIYFQVVMPETLNINRLTKDDLLRSPNDHIILYKINSFHILSILQFTFITITSILLCQISITLGINSNRSTFSFSLNLLMSLA